MKTNKQMGRKKQPTALPHMRQWRAGTAHGVSAQAWRRHRQTRLGTGSEQKKRKRRKRYQRRFHWRKHKSKENLKFVSGIYKSYFIERIFLHVTGIFRWKILFIILPTRLELIVCCCITVLSFKFKFFFSGHSIYCAFRCSKLCWWINTLTWNEMIFSDEVSRRKWNLL